MAQVKAESYCQQFWLVVATQAVQSWLTANPSLQTKHAATPQDFSPQFLQFVIGQTFSTFWVQEVEDPTMALKFCPIYFSKQPRQYRMILFIFSFEGGLRAVTCNVSSGPVTVTNTIISGLALIFLGDHCLEFICQGV
jgi:hypothetical protein